MTRGPEGTGGMWSRAAVGNVLWLSLASFLNDVSSEMIFPLLPLFLVGTLGAGPAFLGLVEGVAETTAAFVKLGGGWLADRSGRRKVLIGGGYALAALARPLMAAAATPGHVFGIRFVDRVGKGARTAPRDALLTDSVPEAVRGRAFGLHRAADHAGAIVGPLLAAGLLLLWPGRLRLVFLLAAVPAALTVAVVVLKVREVAAREDGTLPGSGPDPAAAAGVEVEAPGTAAGLVPPGLLAYLAVLVIFTLGNASDAFLLLRAESVGVALPLIPILWGALHGSKMLWNLVGGILADQVGVVPTLLAGWLVYAATYAGFALAGASWHAWALFALYGLYYGMTEPTEKVLVAALAPPDARGRAFGAYHFAIGIAALPASIIFGLVWEARGPAAAFYLGATLALLAAMLLPLALRHSTSRGRALVA